MGRIRIIPEWVNIIDFETRLPSAPWPPRLFMSHPKPLARRHSG